MLLMYFIFFTTNEVYAAEDVLNNHTLPFEIVPTPIREEIYCGVCIKSDENTSKIKTLLREFRFEIWNDEEHIYTN